MLNGNKQTLHRKSEPLERFIGKEVRVLSRKSTSVNNFIQSDWASVTGSAESISDDRGMLYLFPIEDGRFCLQLCFWQSDESSSGRAIVNSLRFSPSFFDQYPVETLMANQPFRFDQTTEQQFSVCAKTRMYLTQLHQTDKTTPFIRSLRQTETATHLLRIALECITIPFNECQVPACRFLAYESEREKIKEACQVLEQNLDKPLTIPELAKKVAINECYLKKGFKALVGKTVHDYHQDLRIAKAKELLKGQGLTVTEVAHTLGYSSISHFSTAFKRVTGMKPCELLS